MSSGTEISVGSQSESRGLTLTTFSDMMQFANVVAKTDFAPRDFRGKPEACLLAIQHGAEIGLSPMQSLQNIACINGRPAIWGDAALALVMGSPVCEFVRERIEGEGENAVAICETKRRGYGQPAIARFSVADAKRASLWGKSGPWSQYPLRMLQLRARGFALRDSFPDVLKGLVTTEEAMDYPTVDATPAPAALPAKPQPRRLEAPKPGPTVDDPMGTARTSINGATSVKQLVAIVGRIIERTEQGIFSEAQNAELLALADGKRELIEGPKGDAYEETGPGPGKD